MKDRKYYILVTNWEIPEMTGKELVQQLKREEGITYIPVLVLTAQNSEIKLSILKKNEEHYLSKPLDESDLKVHLAQLLGSVDDRLQIDVETLEIDKAKDTHSLAEVDLDSIDQELLVRLEEIILRNISNFDFTIETISSELKMSSRNLSRKIKKLIGLTTFQYIQEIRYQEAKRMLIEKEYSTVKAVIYSVGIKSDKYFSREFKKRFGKYPKEFLR